MADWFSLPEMRAISPLGNETAYPDAALIEAREQAQSAIEDACDVYFTPTVVTTTVQSRGRDTILLGSRLRSVDSVMLAGAAQSLTGVEVEPDGTAYTPTLWPYGRLTVTATLGYDEPPPRVKRAGLLLAKRFLVKSPISDRAVSMQNEDGRTEFYETAGRGGRLFDVPEVNAVVAQYGLRPGGMVA